MKIFLLDLWTDLREKRLWPVALVLLAGLVAAPVVLSKKAEDAPVAPPAPAADNAQPDEPEGPAQLAEVKLEELSGSAGSSLSSFDPSNPFAPPRKVLEKARREARSETGAQISESTLPSAGGGDTTDTGGVTPDTGGGVTPDTGDDTGGDTGGDDTGDTTTTAYTYVLDVTFSANGRKRKIKGMRKLDMLPNAASPLLIFLGVTENAGNGVFLVDSTLVGAGEGNCRPSNAECAFLYIGPGSEHEFTNEDGDSYTIRVDEIRRVKVGAKASASKASKKGKTKTNTANAAVGRDAAQRPAASRRRFALPLLADLVSVSSGVGDDSNSDRDRR